MRHRVDPGNSSAEVETAFKSEVCFVDPLPGGACNNYIAGYKHGVSLESHCRSSLVAGSAT